MIAKGIGIFMGLEQAHEGEKLCFRGVFLCEYETDPHPSKGWNIYRGLWARILRFLRCYNRY